MRRKISQDNPFRKSFRYDHCFVFEAIKDLALNSKTSISVLDYGGNDGKLLRGIIKGGLNVHGTCVDANKEAINFGISISHDIPKLQLIELASFDNIENLHKFDVTLLIGVLEHVVDQKELLNKLRNATKIGGEIIFAVPGRHFFSWADLGNLKFYFPRIHRWFIEKTKGIIFYKTHFIDCANGLFGDIEVGKNRHQHFSRFELKSLLSDCGFNIVEIDGYGYFHYILHNFGLFSPKLIKDLILKIMILDIKYGNSTQLVVRARSK